MSVQKIKEDIDWSFTDLSRKETNYITHNYHHYPAKFIPQLVRKIIYDYSKEGDLVVDPFGGCGTTLIESKLAKRNSICGDINNVAVMISKAKTSIINPKTLDWKNKVLLMEIKKNYNKDINEYRKACDRLKYWFSESQYNKLRIIFLAIQKEKNPIIKNFYTCCFSNILKKCSIWYSKSIKPMKDLNKDLVDPLETFLKHLNLMTKKNEDFFNTPNARNKSICKMIRSDARKLLLNDSSVDLIVTSPPYVTSYEYADIHQLSTLWLGYAEEISKIKKDFVGTSCRAETRKEFVSLIAEGIIRSLEVNSPRLSRSASNYYSDLYSSFSEMYRILKKGKYVCIILGNTEHKSTKILNMEVSVEMLGHLGFNIKKIIKRKLSSKIFTPYRDKNGKFTNRKQGKVKRIYQHEYIIVARK